MAPRGYGCDIELHVVIFKLISKVDIWRISCEIAHRWIPQDWWLAKIVSGNGPVPSGSKPLPEPILTKFYITISHH